MATTTHTSTFDAAIQLVRAHVAQYPIAPEAVPGFISQVHESLLKVARGPAPAGAPAQPVAPQVPAVPVQTSVTDGLIFCLEDGSAHKMMRRYLMRVFGLTPGEYRAKWGLAADYPMTAPGYSAVKRREALAVGLGTKANKSGSKAKLTLVET
jgi:predicted transcriptional regulator